MALNQIDDMQEPILADNANPDLSLDNNNELTQWKVKHECCCCGPYVELTVPNRRIKRHFLRHWEFKPFMPIFVSILILFCTFTNFFIILPNQYLIAQIILPFVVILFLILFCWSYFGAVCMDPGYLPYNWINTKKFSYSWQDQLSGLAVTNEQFEFALNPHNRPPKCSFSHSAGRYVIRGDHICGWIANWVGIRNHKQFMLLNLYGGLFCFSLLVSTLCIKCSLFSFSLTYTSFIVLSVAFEGSFCLTLISMFITTLYDIYNNRTKLNRMRNEATDPSGNIPSNRTFLESMQDVCGTKPCCWNWLIPLPAFDNTLTIDLDDDQPVSDE